MKDHGKYGQVGVFNDRSVHFPAPVKDILTEQFNSHHLAYRTIVVYKACISQLHDPVEGRQLGNLPFVSRFMKGIFKLRPPQPKLYMFDMACVEGIITLCRLGAFGRPFVERSDSQAYNITGINFGGMCTQTGSIKFNFSPHKTACI